MTGASQPSLDDLAYVRQLAESGVRAPLIGGRFMAWWGIALTVAYVLHHLALTGRIGDGRTVFGLICFGFMISERATARCSRAER